MKTTYLQPLRSVALLALLWVLPQSHISAQEFEVDGIWYSVLSESGVKVIANPDNSVYTHSEVILPEKVSYEGVEYAVTEIGASAFNQCANLVSVTIPKSVTTVASKAFYECSGLKYVEIADGSTPLSFTDNYQFWTSPLDSVYIGRDLDFQSGSSRVVRTAGGYSPFVGRTSSQYAPIKSVVFGDFVTVVGESLFRYSASLERIVFGDNVTEILSNAFGNCTSLTSLELPASVTTIDRGFTNCTNISRVVCLAQTPPSLSGFPEVGATLYVPEGCLEAYQNDAVWGKEKYFAKIIDAPYVPDFMVDGIKYSVLGKGKVGVVAINEETKYEGDIVLPETVTYGGVTYALTTICSGAFNDCYNLEFVSIPATVTAIEEEAFCGCSPRIECKAMTPPACVSGSFYNVSGKVYIPEGTLELYRAATGWKDITYLIDAAYVPDFTVDGVTYTQLGKESVGVRGLQPVFIDEYSIINEVVLPETVEHEGITYRLTEICNTGFGSSWLRSIVIPEGVKVIRSFAFQNNRELETVMFPTSLTAIEERAFSQCEKLESVELPEGLTSLGRYAFEWCRSLRKITIPASVTVIEEGTFRDCPADTIIVKSMTPPTLGQGAHEDALGNNYNLLIVPTGSWETYMSTTPWRFFLEIREAGGRSNVFEVDGIRYRLPLIESNEVDVVAGGDYRGDMVIPGTVVYDGKEYVVTAIGGEAFRGCTDLTSVVISEGVTTLVGSAFRDCTNLKSISIPSTLVTGNFTYETFFYEYESYKHYSAFRGCTGLENIVIANNHPTLESRGNAIIRKDSLDLILGCKNTVIPKDVTCIAPYAFSNTGIEDIEIPDNILRIGEHAFGNCDSLTTIHIGSGTTEFTCHLKFNDVKDLGNQIRNVFADCNNLRTIVVDENNSLIDSRSGCNAIVETATNTILLGCNETTIPEGIGAVEQEAFALCDRLEALHIPSTLAAIPSGTFSNCRNLTAITVADGNTVYDSRNGCNAVIETATNTLLLGCVNTVIPQDVEHIAARAFYSCQGWEELVIPDAVQTVGDEAFYNCRLLTSMTFGAGVRELGNNIFPWQYPSLDSPYLETIVFRGATPPTFTSHNPEYELSNHRLCTQLLVPEGSLAAYQSADVWKNFIFITEGEEMVEFESDGILYRVVVGDDYAMVRPRPGKESASEGDDFVYAGMISVYPDSIVIPETVLYDGKEYIVNAIGEYAFYRSELNYLSIPATVDRVGYFGLRASFEGVVICHAAIPPYYDAGWNIYNDAVLRVPRESMELYEQATFWQVFFEYANVEAIEDATGIGHIETNVPYLQSDAVYDLSGRRITDVENLKPGIYIVNGKKVVIR